MAQRLIYTPASLDEGAGFAIALLASGIYGSGLKDAFFREIWNAKDQKWYYEEAKGHIEAVAVECHACRKVKKRNASR